MHRIVPPAAAGILIIATIPAHAEWSGTGRIGGVIARGNTQSATGNATLEVTNAVDGWKHKFGGAMLRTLTEEETSADRWEVRAESEYTPTDRVFSFASARYENDRFTTYQYQATGAVGLGYHLLATERTKLDARVGVGLRRAELRQVDETESDEIVRATVEFEQKLTGNTRLFNRFLMESGEINTFTQNITGIEVKMTEALGLGLTFEIRRNTEVLPGTRNSDQVLTAGLVVGF